MKGEEKIEIFDKIEKVVYLTQPSPVVLVSTISREEIDNVAPFAMFMNCSSISPHMVAIAISPKTDTYANIKETKEFIVGIPKEQILKQVCKAGEKVGKTISEFEFANLTPYQSKKLKVGKVVDSDIDKDKYSMDKVQLRASIPNVYHITGNKFMVNGKLKEIN